MIPGLATPILGGGFGVYYSVSANNVDPWVLLGSPARSIVMNVYVGLTTIIGSSSPANPSMLIRPYNGSTVNLFVSGKIGAAGGMGGGGDRGRQDNGLGSSFVGGGGGGGAGVTAGPGGAHAVEADPDNLSTDGAAGTSTAGGLGGANVFGALLPISPSYIAGSVANRLARNPAVLLWPASGHSITVNIWNGGSIFAGGDGGLGGFQNAPLNGGAQLPANGEDLPAYYDPAPGALVDHPSVGYRTGQVTLNWKAGNVHPSVKGRIVGFVAAP